MGERRGEVDRREEKEREVEMMWGLELEIIATYHSPVYLRTHLIHHIHKTKDVAYL